jgi:DNA polymerase-1
VLFETLKLGGDKVKKTAKTGQYQTSEDILQELSNAHPVDPVDPGLSQPAQAEGHVCGHPARAADPVTHRVHTSYLQTVAATGRSGQQRPEPAEHPHPHGERARDPQGLRAA